MIPDFYCGECGEAIEYECGLCEECEERALQPDGLKSVRVAEDKTP